MIFELQILGSGSAVPTLQRYPTSQVLNIQDHYFLIDCGEGAQMQMRRFGVKLQKIDHIFISHLHGDHYLGLSGYLQTLHLLGREKPITIYGPSQLQNLILDQFTAINATLRYTINFIPTQAKEKELLLETKLYTVHSFPLKHKVPTTGFLFREKPKKRPYNKRIGDSYNIPFYWIDRIKNGEDYESEEGEFVANKLLTSAPPKSYSYAFCSDTAYMPTLKDNVYDVDIMYHEASFLEKHKKRAKETLHSLASDASKQATNCKAQTLVMGHFSARYKNTEAFVDEASPHFEGKIVIAEDGLVVRV